MAIDSFFYDSQNGDRPYSAKDFARAFNIITNTGVVPEDETGNLGFDIGGTNFTTIYAGKASVEGHLVEVTGTETLTVPTGDYAGMIVIRVDITTERKASLVVRQDRIPQQDNNIYELPLYECTVSGGVITGITDVRETGGVTTINKTASNVPIFRDDYGGICIQMGTWSIVLSPTQPPYSAKRVWIQTV